MKATVYEGFGFAHEAREIKSGVPLRESLPDLDLDSCVVVANARAVNGDYAPAESDGVLIRVLPRSPVVMTVVAIVSLVATVVTGVVAGVVAYKQKQALEEQKEELERYKRLTNTDGRDAAQVVGAAPGVNLPFLRGATNAVAKGKSQPYMLGRNMFTPYLVTDKWYELEGVDGAEQYVTQAFEGGFGKQALESASADNIVLKALDYAAGPQEGVFDLVDDSGSTGFSAGGTMEIAQDGEPFAGMPAVNSRVASSVDNAEIPYDADVQEGRKTELVYTLDPCAMNVRLAITFAGGLYTRDMASGGLGQVDTDVVPSYSLDGGATWTDFTFAQAVTREISSYKTLTETVDEPMQRAWLIITSLQQKGYFFTFGPEPHSVDGVVYTRGTLQKFVITYVYDWAHSNRFSRCELNEIRFEATKAFTFSDYQTLAANGKKNILLRVRNLGYKVDNVQNAVHLMYHESQCFDANESLTPAGVLSQEEYQSKHPSGTGLELEEVVSAKVRSLSTMLAVRLKANAANQEKLNKINFISHSLARTWDAENETWSEGKTTTSNPAALALEVLTSDTHPLSKFDDDEIDLDSFGAWAEFCGEENIAFNAVVSQPGEKQKVLEQICSVGRASLYWNAEGKLAVAFDAPQETAVANLDKDSLVSLEVEKELARGVDALRLTYVDERTWSNKTITMLNAGVQALDADSVIKELTVTGITRYEQAAKYARYILACMNIRLKTVSIKVGNEGIVFSPCTKLIVADDALGAVPQELLITSSSCDGDGWTLKCVDYDARIYDPGTIPEYVSHIEQLGEPSSGIPDNSVSQAELDRMRSDIATGAANFGVPDAPTIASCVAGRDSIALACEPLGGGARNSIGMVTWQIAKTAGEPSPSDWSDFSETTGLTAQYRFNRRTEGYPEREDLAGSVNWRFRAKVENAYGQESEWSEAVIVNTSEYGTWAVQAPTVDARVSDRTITLVMGQPPRADNREIYGNLKFKVQVKRPADDNAWFKPATSANPYPVKNASGEIVAGNEDNYKDGQGFAVSDSKWIQTMPLKGQATKEIVDTLYSFKLTAYNEAGESQPTELNVTALCTNIQDIVQAKETFKEAYITDLSAISANVGTILEGSFGDAANLWDLSTFIDKRGFHHYRGRLRVGGAEQYLHVDPILDGDVPTGEYNITFKVGNFEVSSTSSQINGDLVIQESPSSLDRTVITPNGTRYQHRESPGSAWFDVAANGATGAKTMQVFSNNTLCVTNQTMAQRRAQGIDIGNPYLSPSSKVYHFDTDFNDQNQVDDLTLDGTYSLKGAEDRLPNIDFTPAILAVAPYATEGKSLYGQYSLAKAVGTTAVFTVDFWIQYIYAEGQTLFSVGGEDDRIELIVLPDEVFFEVGTGDISGIPFNQEIALDASHEFVQILDASAKPWNAAFKYYTKRTVGGVDTYELTPVAEADYEDMVAQGLYEATLPFNAPQEAHSELSHSGLLPKEVVDLRDMGISFCQNEWVHFGIVFDSGTAHVRIDDQSRAFTLARSGAQPYSALLNPSKNTFILDELMIDPTTAEGGTDFTAHTANRIPWGSLDKGNDYFILTADDLANFKTNIFDSALFRAKVNDIIDERTN